MKQYHVIETLTGREIFRGSLFECRAKLDRLGAYGYKAIDAPLSALITNA